MNESRKTAIIDEASAALPPELVEKIETAIAALMESAGTLLLLADSLREEKEKVMGLQIATEQLAAENAALRAKVRELDMPWWRRFFRPRLNVL
jgi:ABC-type branched-subunit amino acid transport system ATPase component